MRLLRVIVIVKVYLYKQSQGIEAGWVEVGWRLEVGGWKLRYEEGEGESGVWG